MFPLGLGWEPNYMQLIRINTQTGKSVAKETFCASSDFTDITRLDGEVQTPSNLLRR